MAVLRSDSTIGGKSINEIVYHDDIPRVYLSGGLLPVTKDNQIMKMKYVSKIESFECWITIKCQGTSSLSYDKKNFSIRLYEDEALTIKLKKNFKGWGAQYKFVWKANYIDLSHARNIVSARLWADCVKTRSTYDQLPQLLKDSPNQGAIDGFFIRVYYNGIYQGRYTWNIPKDPWMTNMDETLEEHCLLCSENYDSGCFRAEALIDETDWTDEIHSVVPNSVKTRWNEVISFVMNSTDADFKANLNNYIDVTSIIDYYLFHYVCCGLDAFGKNQVYITYDGQKYYATSYDMDSTWGLYWDGSTVVSPAYRMQKDYETGVHGTSNLLFDRLEALFKQEIYDRYQVLRSGPLSLENIIDRFESFMICDEAMIREDYEIYPGIPSQSINNIKQIRQYATNRLNYVDDCISAFTAPEVTANKLYELTAETTLNGTSDYVDTGIQLFDTAKDWTLIFYGKANAAVDSQTANATIFHCMNEDGYYDGCSLSLKGDSYWFESRNLYTSISDHPTISTNTIKIAVTCEAGNIKTIKYINNNGIETVKNLRCNYGVSTRNLILGAYTDSNGNKGRFWNGTISKCVVYDTVLTGGQINNIMNGFIPPNGVLRNAFSPRGTSFIDTADIDWNAQEVYVTMDLSTCENENENVLSIGNEIGTWSSINCVHIYYTASSNRMIGDANGGFTSLDTTVLPSSITIVLNSNGLYIDGTLYDNAYLKTPTNISTIQIGSAEGTTRSNANNYHIEIRNKS